MSLSGYQSINNAVRYAAGDFDFAGTLGDFVGNAEFSYGSEDYKADVSAAKSGGYAAPNARSNIWHVLSAIGQDIGEVTYANVKNYIDVVSNIDMCKTRALTSMMKNVGMDYSVIGDIDDFPLEVLNLIDIFSIDKKYLLDNDKIKEDLIQDIRLSASSNSRAESREYYRLFENGFSISTANPEARGKLVLDEDNGYDGLEVAGRFTSFDDLVAAGGGVYDPALRFVTCRKYSTPLGSGRLSCEIRKFSVPSFSDGQYTPLADGYALLSAGSVVCSAEAGEFEDLVAPGAEAARPFGSAPLDITVKYDYLSGESRFTVGGMSIDEEKYHDYVKSVFIELLSSYLDMRYNVTSADIKGNEIHPIHFYIKDEYLQNGDYYKSRAQLTSDSMRFKRINNIPYSFNEQRILDDIDAGLDDLDNYDGHERQLLDMEIDRRARRLTYSDMTPGARIDDYSAAFLSSDDFKDVSNNKTRYSYYRKAKVLEYARFVDNVFALGEIGSGVSDAEFTPYRFDADYYVIGDLSAPHIFKYDGLSSLIDQDELFAVAENLTTYTQYIARLRNKIKLQVRKNYMKGTNNLLIYLINQFLVDYSRTSRLFKTYGGGGGPLAKVYENLSSSDSDDIEIVEYRDDTEYYNLESDRSLESMTQSYNNDFKQAYFKPIIGGTISAFDGKLFTLDQIKEFYLSSLGLKNYISDDTDGFIQFISSVFEMGRSDSFIDERGYFACKLNDGRYTTELWDELNRISGSYTIYKGYLSAGDYEYPADTVQNQLTDVVENYVGRRLSDQYLSDVSDVYDQYHGEIEQMSSDLMELSTQYSELTGSGDYALYLNKSACKYCYTNGEDDLVAYRHDWYNGNSAVYASQYLIDKIGDLRRFASDEKNMKCYPVLDTLEYIKNTFDRISAQLMSDAEKPAEGYGYVDIESPYLDQEMRSIYAYLESESNLRKSELQGILANIRQQAQQAKETYDKLDNAFAAAMANYDTGDGTPMGTVLTDIFGQCNNPSECSHDKWVKSDSSYEKFYKKYKDDESIAAIVSGILIRDTQSDQDKKGAKQNIAFYQYADEDKNAKKAKYDRFTVNEDLGGGECAITEDMSLEQKIPCVQTWMSQVIDGHVEQGDDGDCIIADPVYGYMNAGVLAAVNSIEGDVRELGVTVDSIAQQIADIGGGFQASGYIKDKIDQLQKYVGTEIDSNFSEDVKIKACAQLRKIISNLSAQYDNLKLVYDAMPSDSEYADYIMEAYKSAFTAENIDALSVYAVKKGIGDKVKIIAEIKQMIDRYNTQQNLYTAVAEQIDAQISGAGMLEPDPYLELLLEYIMNKLIRDVQKKIERAQEHIAAGKLSVYGTIDILSTQISGQMLAYEHDFEYYFDQYLSTLNFFQRPEYLSAYELFKTYGGTGACYDPYYNYKNVAHPSFQVHPFLWNFVEATGIRDVVSRSFDGLFNEKLERLQIRKYIDGVIGEFGQIVNIWQNNTTDSTGYTTRYEINAHTDEGVEYSPVVDYDGGFYPPAVQSYLQSPAAAVRSVRDAATSKSIAQNIRKALADVTMSALYRGDVAEIRNYIYNETSLCVEPYYPYSGYMDIVSAFAERYTVQTSAGVVFNGTKENLRDMAQQGLSGTFYENYYQHLHIDADAPYREYIADQLSCEDVYRRIQAIAEDKDAVSDVYDIYRYGLDNSKNIYVLYKKYREPNPTFKEKRNTPGALWIRLKNHPIAFPALLSGQASSYQACDIAPASKLNSYLSGVSAGALKNRRGQPVDFIDIDGYCYDFSFSYDREAIAMACVNRDAADPIFRTYDYPELVMSIIESRGLLFNTRRRTLCFSNNDGAADDVVSQPDWVPSAAEIMQGVSAVCPVYLGAYSPSLKNIRLVYAYKSHSRYNDSGDILSVGLYSGGDGDVSVMIARYNENTTGIGYKGNACIPGRLDGIRPTFDVTSHEIAFTCDNVKKEKLTFAFPVQRNTTKFVTYNGVTVDVEPNSEGGCVDDPTSREMTSHDVLDEHIAIVHAHFNGQLYQDGDPTFYNLNADMSYQPVYPGYSHIYRKAGLSSYENIELLGKSKDIVGSIASVNPNADPYFELSDMLENGVYGRVYENYASAEYGILNSMFIIKQNPAFGENKKENGSRPIGNKYYEWVIDLSGNFTEATSSDVAGMNIVMFNTQNMGKNPYFIGKIGDLVTSGESQYVPAYYNSAESERECPISSLSSDGFSGKFTIAGINRQGYTNSMDNNRIGNIGAIEMRMDMPRHALHVLFNYEAVDKEAHIPEGRVRCVFYDDKNLKQFEYYHMLDSYGAVNAYEMLRNRAAYDYVVKGRGWKIIYDSSKDDKFRDKIKSFILDGDGVRQYLDDIDLDEYSFLSDVYLYRDDKLAFKYNEEDMFEYTHSEYHYPFLNRKYPNTIAQYYSTHMNFGVRNQSQSDDQLSLFNESNLFVLNYDEGNRLLSAMGQVAIPIYETDDEDTLRVFEDYLSVYTDDNGVSGYNSDRYADDDPRLFQFTHFVAYPKAGLDDFQDYSGTGGRDIPSAFWWHRTVDEFCDSVLTGLSGYQYISRECESQALSSAAKYVYVTPTAENCSISDILNIQVNYSKDADGRLTLFFNYANYINTPFVKYADGKFKIDTIDRTYLMLKPGESGELDIVVQARYYVGEELYGYRNIKMLTFKIHNLSDDKPKFYITKTYELRPGELDVEKAKPTAKLGVLSAELDINAYSPEQQTQQISCDVTFTVEASHRVMVGSTIEVVYPAYMIQPVQNTGYAGYAVEDSQSGVALVTLNDPDITEFTIRFRTATAGHTTVQYANRRYAIMYGRTNISSVDGRRMTVQTAPGAFMIKNNVTYIIAEDAERKPVGAGLRDGDYTGIYMHNI